MSRREFKQKVKRAALDRAKGTCEAAGCDSPLVAGRFHFDHIIPDALGGEPTLDNCAVLCFLCHRDKTTKHDVPRIAKSKRISRHFRGIRKEPQLKSRGFERAAAQNSASRPLARWTP